MSRLESQSLSGTVNSGTSVVGRVAPASGTSLYGTLRERNRVSGKVNIGDVYVEGLSDEDRNNLLYYLQKYGEEIVSVAEDEIDAKVEEALNKIPEDYSDIAYMAMEAMNIAMATEGKIPATVEYDEELSSLVIRDKDGNDLYDPVKILQGTGTGGGGGSSSIVKLTNNNGTASIMVANGKPANLMFTFTSTESDIPTGNGACQITVNGAVKSTFNIEQGPATVDVSKYLSNGSNTVRVRCTDVYGTYKQLVYTVTLVSMYITSTFDSTLPYSGDVPLKYTPYGAIDKTIHILVDGNEVSTTEVSTSGKQITYTIPKLSHGVHRLELYATTTIDDVDMESEPLVYDVICVDSSNNSPMIASAYTVETIKQGGLVSIPYIVYDPTKLSCDITLEVYTKSNGAESVYHTQNLTVDRQLQYWNTRQYPFGEVYFRIVYGDISKTHTINVEVSDIDVNVESNDLELELVADNRSNNEDNPGVWTYGDYSTTFENFNWNSDGWVTDDKGDTCLRLSGAARAEVNFKPFVNDIRTYGKTIELEFAIRDVNARDEVVIGCISDGIGFEVTADTAHISSEQSNVFCKYKDGEKVKLAFTVESRSEYRQLSVYLNGILSDVIQYPDSDNFQQSNAVNISIGSSKCGIDVYSIRSYGTALEALSNVNNFIADIEDLIDKTEAHERNDIYDEYGNISFEKCKAKNSVMVITGTLPQSKGDKKNVKVSYYDIDDSSIDYVEDNVEIDVQGTSSQYFVRKNWKMKFSKDRYIDKDHLPAKVICIKVDYAEATGTHNTQNANFVETLYSEPTPAQKVDPACRTTIYGKPILLFHQADESSDPVFYGKANYNYDKGAEYVFGFTSDYDVECWEFKNNTSGACNFTSTIPSSWGDDFEARYPEDYTNITRFKRMHDWVVSTKNDLEKFKMEFENYFDMHYCLIYYVYTFFALMVDQRAKNMFLTYWGKTGKWQPWFYDNDTSFGINNEGQLVFDYYHEDVDQLEGANIYNGQNSVLWSNFRRAFPDEIKETYQDLRNNGLITYAKLEDRFITQGSDKWSESIYNEDGDFKYISMLRSENDATNLPQVRGSGEEHFRYFIENRLNYCDSKWYASDYADDYISLRIYTPITWAGIEPNPAITVTPFSNMYAGVRYKANGTLYQERVDHGDPVTFRPQGETFESENNETFNDTETAIYGAHQLSSIGDLAPLYCGSVNVSKADKLIELKVGDSTEGYSNTNLRELSVGTNTLLKKIDVCNCPNFASVLALSNCPSIEEVYATGSSITGVEFPDSGCLKVAHLPATITNFTIKNQMHVEEITLAGYNELKTIWIENTPAIDGLDLLSKSPNVNRVRLTGIDVTYDTAAEMLALAARPIGGIDENGTNIDKMWIDGKCHIKTLTGAEFLRIKEAFPYMTITYDTLTAELIFMSEDGSTELTRQTIQNGGNGTDPVTAGTLTKPTKTSTAQYTYTFAGWSKTAGGNADSTALNKVEADRKVYAAFSSELRKYTVYFYNGTTLLQTVNNVPYGGTATYTGETPSNNSTGNPADFQFYGWSPSPTNIQGNTSCYAQYNDLREITDDWATIKSKVDAGTATYGVGAFKTLDIGEKGLPFSFRSGSAIVFDNEIHIIGGAAGGVDTKHYKWNGYDWTSDVDLPFQAEFSSLVVFNNEIHILGSNYSSSYYKRHYKFNGSTWMSVSTLPYNFRRASAVVYNNEIHIIGSYDSSHYKSHYKWNGSEWSSVSTLPYDFYDGSVIVYNNEIHIIGSNNSTNGKSHYKWTGTEWVSTSTLPYDLAHAEALVYNNEIHILGSYDPYHFTAHYKWDGSEWSSVSTLPYDFYQGCAVIYNDKICIMGSGNSYEYKSFYSYSSETETWSKVGITESIPMQIVATNHDLLSVGKWERLGQLPYSLQNSSVLLYNNEIHIMGSYASSSHYKKHYKWNGTEWASVSTLPYDFYYGEAVVYNNEIHIMGSGGSRQYHYKYDGTEWTSVSTLPYEFCRGSAVVYNNEIHIMGSISYKKYHYKYDGTEWTSVSTLPYDFYGGSAVVYNNEIHIMGSYASSSHYKKHYKWDGSSWTSVSTLPYGFREGSVILYNNEIHIMGSDVSDSRRCHYKYNGTAWASVSTLTYDFYNGSAIVYHDICYIIGGSGASTRMEYFNTTNPKASLTFVAKNLLAEPRVMSDSNDSWSNSDLREWLNGEFLTTLPSDLQTAIATVAKISDNGPKATDLVVTNDNVWIPSFSELRSDTRSYILPDQGATYPIFTDISSIMFRPVGVDDGNYTYWTRSTATDSLSYIAIENGVVATANGIKDRYILIGFCI